MRSYDKKKNIEKANILSELRYLESKGAINKYDALVSQIDGYEIVNFHSKPSRLSPRYHNKKVYDLNVVLKTNNNIFITFDRWVDEDPDGVSSGMNYDVIYNGDSIKDNLNNDSIEKIEEIIEEVETDLLEEY